MFFLWSAMAMAQTPTVTMQAVAVETHNADLQVLLQQAAQCAIPEMPTGTALDGAIIALMGHPEVRLWSRPWLITRIDTEAQMDVGDDNVSMAWSITPSLREDDVLQVVTEFSSSRRKTSVYTTWSFEEQQTRFSTDTGWFIALTASLESDAAEDWKATQDWSHRTFDQRSWRGRKRALKRVLASCS